MRRPILLSLATLVAAALPMEAQRWRSDDYDDVEGAESCREIWREFGRSMRGRPVAVFCEIREIGTQPATGTIDVDGEYSNGVHISGTKRNDVRVRLVVQAQGEDADHARQLARELRLDLTARPLRVRGVDRTSQRSSRKFVAATIVLETPEQANLSASVAHAPMNVENVRGRLDLYAEHGPLTLTDVGGEVRARVAHGPLTVRVEGTRWQGAGLDAEAQHGPLTVSLPRAFNADIEIGAEHGPMDIDFPITLTRFDRTRIETKLGQGGPRIRAFARHGPLSIRSN